MEYAEVIEIGHFGMNRQPYGLKMRKYGKYRNTNYAKLRFFNFQLYIDVTEKKKNLSTKFFSNSSLSHPASKL